MNNRIKELADQVGISIDGLGYGEGDAEGLAKAIVEECIDILRQEWYTLNNAPKVEGETPRDVGIRVGQKSELIKMIEVIKKKFEDN